MKISIVRQSDQGLGFSEERSPNAQLIITAQSARKMILIEHNNESLSWKFPSRVWKPGKNEEEDGDSNSSVFDEMNQYLATLPVYVQDMIFQTYREINQVLTSTEQMQDDTVELLMENIKPLASRLFSFIDRDHFTSWVWNTLRPRVPNDVKETFDPLTMPGSIERTYLRADYYDLIPLVLVVRLACPFWFGFSELTKESVTNNQRDVFCYMLIEDAWPTHSPAMKRLEVFVDHTVGNQREREEVVLAGISSDAFVHWTLSSVVVKRCPVVDARGNRPDSTPVVSALYSHVCFRISAILTGSPKITAKFATVEGGDSENNISFLEGFRNRQAVSTGSELSNEHYLAKAIEAAKQGRIDPYSLLDRVAPGIDIKLVIDALESSKALHKAMIVPEQINLASWLFHPYSQAKAVGSFKKDRIIEMLALAQAVCLHQKRPDLAAIVTGSYRMIGSGEDDGGSVGETVEGLRAADRAELGKVFTLERAIGAKRLNIVISDMQMYILRLQSYKIRLTFSDYTLAIVQGAGNNSREYELPRNTLMIFMNFLKYLATREIVTLNPDEVYASIVANKSAE